MLIINLFYEFSINHVSDANMSEMDAIIAAVSNDVNNNYDDEKKYKRNAKGPFIYYVSTFLDFLDLPPPLRKHVFSTENKQKFAIF